MHYGIELLIFMNASFVNESPIKALGYISYCDLIGKSLIA